jgi:hypothetical protein
LPADAAISRIRKRPSRFACATAGRVGPLEGMDYYDDDYPDVPVEEFLAVFKRLTKYARREVFDLAESLAAGRNLAEGDG